ncbi:hypothetical protein B0T26DRAFT_866153 [Lasiosphaeria miniovina]|uniref:Uncharacterized protein n=1 Tax=Lasiosphaeria miniovina TaxID=1954250 RepID=A0AA39ZQX5_9PEZI|nr:uncharacterized protein B0T26DRAFT_866153 [Lasiosphaeria miniovina]KAK0702070.1 hypothetical protein B0T26DRAFT_866153 [Lasiosphaeria miniovina]
MSQGRNNNWRHSPRGEHAGRFDQRRPDNWKEGDVAFLLPASSFSAEDHNNLIAGGYMAEKATGHPVIILKRISGQSTHILVTPVSAYSSGDFNNFLPPWRQICHSRKKPRDFRSFDGCERSNSDYPPLFLEGGMSMPKPQASWVNIQSVWSVPLTVIGRFHKSRDHLRVRHASLDSLRAHMARRCALWCESNRRLVAAEPRPAHPFSPSPTSTTTATTPATRAAPATPATPAAPAVPPHSPVRSWASIACDPTSHAASTTRRWYISNPAASCA